MDKLTIIIGQKSLILPVGKSQGFIIKLNDIIIYTHDVSGVLN